MGTRTILPPIEKPKYQANRPLDFLYDPTYTVTDAKEYYKTVHESMQQSSEYVVQPNYSSMFSDVARYPRVTVVLKSANPIPDDLDPSFRGKLRAMECTRRPKVNVKGEDRFKFFRKPLVQMPSGPPAPPKSSAFQPYTAEYDIPAPTRRGFRRRESELNQKKYESSCCQTDYRESETQTTPWAPPYIVTGPVTPEILTLTSLAWGQGLPAGVHEVEIIERARQKRAWEKLFYELDTPDNSKEKYKCMEDMEKDEWFFRAAEIDMIQSMRMQLAGELMKKKQKMHQDRFQERILHITKSKEIEVKNKLLKAKQQRERELRKLYLLHKGIKKNQKKRSALEEITDPASQLHGPMLIYGDVSRHRHEDIDFDKEILADFDALTFLENSRTKDKLPFDYIRLSKPKTYFEMCPKIMSWSEENMEKLQEDIKKIQVGSIQMPRTANIIERLPSIKKQPQLKAVLAPARIEVDLYTSVTFLQKVMRGRACQALMYKDRGRFKYLIQELKSTHALEDIELKKLTEIRYNSLKKKRMNLVHQMMEAKKKQLIAQFSGEVASDLLVFLAEEQERLQDEQRIHAFAMLAERERWRREAAESGRRQREDIFRQQQDNAFKQVMSIRQETVDLYLEDIILKSMNTLAEHKARKYIRSVAKRIDLAAYEADQRGDIIEQEEMVTHLLHNFLVPEAHKEIVRSKFEAKQKKYLEIAHNIVHNQLLTSEPAIFSPSNESISPSELGSENKKKSKKKSQLMTPLALKKTKCVEETSSEEIQFRERENEILEFRKKELHGDSEEQFPQVKGPLKQLVKGSIAFTKTIIDEAKEEASRKTHDVEEDKDFAENEVEETEHIAAKHLRQSELDSTK